MDSIYMRAKAVYFGPFRDATGTKEEEFELPEGLPVREFLSRLVEKYGDRLAGELYREGQLKEHVNVLIDGKDIRILGGLDAPLRAHSRVALFFAIGGG
ncbi:MAG: MoaD/ThiS family protein [Promethearchaeota archaeon]